jgi:hypothetical protein
VAGETSLGLGVELLPSLAPLLELVVYRLRVADEQPVLNFLAHPHHQLQMLLPITRHDTTHGKASTHAHQKRDYHHHLLLRERRAANLEGMDDLLILLLEVLLPLVGVIVSGEESLEDVLHAPHATRNSPELVRERRLRAPVAN